jgi:diguanylate cyclase
MWAWGRAAGGTRSRYESVAVELRRFLATLPRGQLLPQVAWSRRHRWIVVLVWLQAVGLFFFALARGYSVGHSALDASVIAAAAVVASVERLGRQVRSVAASLGLVSCSAVLVHLWGGTVEAHFHFFVVIPILVLYQDWVPFLVALIYVVLHHGVLGALNPEDVYNHAAGQQKPWLWALIHGAFVLAASAACLVGWRANEQMLHEPLTGLPGRTVFIHRVSLALERLKSESAGLAVLFLDLDRFKLLNDTLGHAFGDELLVAAAERLRRTVRGSDVVARFGGDEFAVLCEDVSDRSEVIALAERLGAALRSPFHIRGASTVTNASIGIAFSDPAGATADALIAEADAAMYRAKAVRGDRYVIFDETMRREDSERLATETALRSALPRDQLRLVYQPMVSLPDQAVAAVEVLLRWQHPDRGEIAPAQFIPAAEQTGLIVPIGRWVLEQACLEATTWPSTAPAGAPVLCVNLSARQFGQADVVEMVDQVLRDTGLEPHRLGLEITESALMQELDCPLETLHKLKRLGVRLVLDDFGTGYSSLSYLQRFPIDTLKADRSFVAALGERGEGDRAVLTAVAMLGHAIDVELVAEGVETPDQLRALNELGYDLVQGFYVARPQSSAGLRAVLESAPAGETPRVVQLSG